jgi:histidyl-tRNA synthetase
LLTHLGEAERNYCLTIAPQLRSAGINTEIYPDITKKISKQFDYANKKQIPYVVVIGSEEMKTGELTLKNMASGKQQKIKLQPLITLINANPS